MKKILFVSNTANFSKFNKPYMKWCSENGWQVDYCAPNDEVVTDCDNHIVLPIPRSPFSKGIFKCIKQLRKILNQQKYDVIHCHTPMGSVIARLASKKLFKKNKVKVIYTAHGFHFYKGAPLLNWILYYPVEKYLSKFTNVLITINNEDFQIAKKKFKTKEILFSNGVGVDLKKFKPLDSVEEKNKLRVQKNISKDDFVILYIAEFIPRKNHKLIFDILPALNEKINNLKIILVGKGELLEFYQNYVKENNISNVVFTGYSSEINTYCNLADMLLMPSFQEGLPISMIESIATGLPVVASKIRGHVDVIKSDKNGFLCDLSDLGFNTNPKNGRVKALSKACLDRTYLRFNTNPKNGRVKALSKACLDRTYLNSFVDAIVRLYNSPTLRKEISSNNIQRAKDFSIDNVLNNTTCAYL